MRNLSRKQAATVDRLWVRVPRLPLNDEKTGSWSNRKTSAPHAGNPGATPGESTARRIVPWSNGKDAWLTSRKRWFNSVRDYFDRAQICQLEERLGSGTSAPRGSPSVCRFESCSEDTSLSSWKDGFNSHTGHVEFGDVVELGDTRRSERRAVRRGSSNLPFVTRTTEIIAGGPVLSEGS